MWSDFILNEDQDPESLSMRIEKNPNPNPNPNPGAYYADNLHVSDQDPNTPHAWRP